MSSDFDRRSAIPLVWIHWSLELLWLAIVILVPLTFMAGSDGFPPPNIYYLSLVKVGLFRTLIGAMCILWLIEWALRNRIPPRSLLQIVSELKRTKISIFGAWLKDHPVRWVLVAVVLFLVSVLLSTVLSASFSMSLWGDVPGQEGYSTYTVACHLLLFGIIATHLRTKPQLWRLFGAIVVVGVLISGYAILQFYGLGFLQLQPTGYQRIISTLGNPVYVGAFILLTVSISTVAATINLVESARTARFWTKTGIWSILLTLQFLGLIFTLSRGPWIGTIVSLLGFLALVGIFIGWRTLGRALSVLLIASIMTVAVITLTGSRTTPSGPDSLSVEVGERFVSIGSEVVSGGFSGREVVSGGFSGRLDIWRTSWSLMVSRPWFELEDLKLRVLRPLIGYGPETFRVTFLMAHPPQGENLLPYEPQQAHNYLIHQGVELGFLGLFASFSIFGVFGLAVAYLLLKKTRSYSAVHRLILVGLLATLGGRFAEQMVGLSRVSDMAIFWVLLGIFVALPAVIGSPVKSDDKSLTPLRTSQRARSPRRPRRARLTQSDSSYWKFAVLLLPLVVVATVSWITWVKGVNYVLAAQEARTASQAYRQGDFQNSLKSLNKAINLTPDFWVYYHHRGSVYSAFLNQYQGVREPICSLRSDYELCLAEKAYSSHQQGEQLHNLSFRGRSLLAESAERLALLTKNPSLSNESIRLRQESIALVPGNWRARNNLAMGYDNLGQPEAALHELNESLLITGGTRHSAKIYNSRGVAYYHLGHTEKAIDDFNEAIRLDPDYLEAYRNREVVLANLLKPPSQ